MHLIKGFSDSYTALFKLYLHPRVIHSRPYQIAATERILWKINSAYQGKNRSKTESGGYIWQWY
jgi:type I site-specific restriction-modification system R (restriction) subunit